MIKTKKKKNLKTIPQMETIVFHPITKKNNKRILDFFKGDLSILLIVLFLSIFGIIMVYSASSYNAKKQYGDQFYFMKKQLIGWIIGCFALVFFGALDYRKLKKFKYVSYMVPLILLALVLIPGIGKSNYGARRWIAIGGITIQPSELAKYGFVIFSASYLSDNISSLRTFKGMLPILLAGGIICVLIILEPNMSVTMCVGMLMIAILYLGGAKIKYLLAIILPGIIAVPIMIISEPYRLLRLSAFIDPFSSPKNEGYQLIQSLYALGNGGFFGTGLFKSRQKYRFLPFSESDFILSIIGEEFGFFGIIIFFILSGILIYRGIKVAGNSKDFYSYIMAIGITLVYGIQTLINALVVSGTIPPTGLPLPLISSGNTSLIVTMAAFGILYSISIENNIKRRNDN